MNSLVKRLLLISTILTLGIILLVGCGGQGSMNRPGVDIEGKRQTYSADSTATNADDQQDAKPPLLYGSNHADKQAARNNEQYPIEVPDIND